MADAPRDNNNIPAKLAVLNTDSVQGQNLVPLTIDSDGFIRINTNAIVHFVMQPIDPKDSNYVNCWLFQGSDGLTYPAVADSVGRLLVNI